MTRSPSVSRRGDAFGRRWYEGCKSPSVMRSLPLLIVLTVPGVAQAGNPFGLKSKIKTKVSVKAPKADAATKKKLIRKAQVLELKKLVHEKLTVLEKTPGFIGIKRDRKRFERDALVEIEKNPDRYFRTASLTSEEAAGGVVTASLEMEVDAPGMFRMVSLLDRRIAEARFPKIMFLVKEQYTAQNGEVVTVEPPVFRGFMQDALIARGFDLVAKEQVERLRMQDAKVFESLMDKPNKAAILHAASYGAEYLVVADVKVRHTSFDAMGLKAHRGRIDISLQAVDASTGALIHSTNEDGNSPPNCYDEDTMRTKSVKMLSAKMLEPFIDRIVQSWDRDTENGIRYTVRLYGVKSKKRQGLRFIELLGKLPEVKLVKQLTFAQGRMELEVFYSAAVDVTHLEAAVLQASEKVGPLKTMDVKATRGRELDFTL